MRRPEQALQKTVVQFLQYAAPDDLFWTAINPVPGKSPAIAGLSKALGMRAGVADFLFIWQGIPFFIELKAKGGRQSPAQRETSLAVAKASTLTHVCRSIEEVEFVLSTGYHVPLKARAA